MRRRGAAAPFVGIDDGPAIGAAVAGVVAGGGSRVSYIGGPEATSTGRDRRDAFLVDLRAAGLAGSGLVRLGPPRMDFGRRAMAGLLGLVADAAQTRNTGSRDVAAAALILRRTA